MQAFGGVHHGERDRAGLEALGHVAQWTGDPQHLRAQEAMCLVGLSATPAVANCCSYAASRSSALTGRDSATSASA